MKLMTKTNLLMVGLLGAFSSIANAIIPGEEPTQLNAASAKLYCTTPETCGSYTADYPLQVSYINDQAKLYWSQNVPRGIAAGRYIAYTKGAACPSGSAIPNMTATWYLGLGLKPYRAEAIHCDGTTVSEFRVVLSGIEYTSGFAGF